MTRLSLIPFPNSCFSLLPLLCLWPLMDELNLTLAA
jgi:hypothetical protein